MRRARAAFGRRLVAAGLACAPQTLSPATSKWRRSLFPCLNRGRAGFHMVHPPQSCYGGRVHLFRKLGSLQPSCPESQSPAPKGPTQVATGEIPAAGLNPWANVPNPHRPGGADDEHANRTASVSCAPRGAGALLPPMTTGSSGFADSPVAARVCPVGTLTPSNRPDIPPGLHR